MEPGTNGDRGAEPSFNPPPRSASAVIRFGAYELDVRAGELRKQGTYIRLQDQPFQILRMLLDRPGEVVLREEIQEKLWPNGTVVEFDHSINAAVKRLRDTLLDSADQPRYIETLARRGYRFIGDVHPSVDPPSELDIVPAPLTESVPQVSEVQQSRLVARFGVFEVDLDEGTLFKNGRQLNLQVRPFRLLAMLLDKPGDAVTRERLKETLWSTDTFVDFDRSLNAAIAKLRLALGDSAENPRFIETLSRRGYRFIAPVDLPVSNQQIARPLHSPHTRHRKRRLSR